MENGYVNGGVAVERRSPVSLTNGHRSPPHPSVAEFAVPADKHVNENTPAAHRIKHKAKRLTKFLTKEAANGTPAISTSRYLKNSRKPRNGFGRGLPKKGELKIQSLQLRS